jgi:hypothetical protein
MTIPQQSEKTQTSLTQDLLRTAQYYLGSRRKLMVLAGITIVAGLTFNWSWLVAAGIAPLLISVLPCVAMCAIGVCCMKKSAGQSIPAAATDDKPSQILSGRTVLAIQNPVRKELPMGDVEQRPNSGDAASSLGVDNQRLKERKPTDA